MQVNGVVTARPFRIEYEGAYYHITSRGNEQKAIFKNTRDREKFLGYLASATERYQTVKHAYCLMDNHYHLFVETPAGNLSQIMQHINGANTTYFNVKRQPYGHLFQGRYKSLLVDADEYALELSRYIHLNPVRARMVERPEKYEWSSYCAYIYSNNPHSWLRRDFILDLFGMKPSLARKEYRRYVEAMEGKEYEGPLRDTFASTIQGNREFINQIRAKYVEGTEADRNLPDVRHFSSRPDIDQISEQVKRVITEDSALMKRVQLYLCHRYSGQKLKDIGLYFGIGESGVSQASRRARKQINKDKELKKRVDEIHRDLNLSRV